MNAQFSGIKVLIWDFDGTLFHKNQDLWRDVRDAEYKTIADHTHWPKEKIVKEFEKVYKVITPSATEAVAMICHIPTAQAAVENERYFDRINYISSDKQLIALFAKLSTFRHFILANGAQKPIKRAVIALGLTKNTFEEVVTSEVVGVNKPHEDGFRYIISKTKLPPAEHLMIGDREAVDLVPAKAVGMKTCLVWSEVKSSVADVTLPTVYDVGTLLV